MNSWPTHFVCCAPGVTRGALGDMPHILLTREGSACPASLGKYLDTTTRVGQFKFKSSLDLNQEKNFEPGPPDL